MTNSQWGRPDPPEPPSIGHHADEAAQRAPETGEIPVASGAGWSSWGDGTVTRAPAPAPAQRSRKTRGTVVGVLVVVLVVVLAAAVASYLYLLRPAWDDGDAQLAERYPALVSDRENGEGWRGMNCSAREADDGQNNRIVCADDSMSLVIVEFAGTDARDSGIPADGRETLSNGNCTVQTVEVPGNEHPTYAVAPLEPAELADDALLLSGQDAADVVTTVPVC